MIQQYDAYSPEDFQVWKTLYERQHALIGKVIAREYLQAMDDIGFNADEIPRIDRINEVLHRTTGWEAVVVPGILPDREFFQLLAQKKFPATTWLRKPSQLDYLEEPDMFHDVFGHVPLLTEQEYTDFLQGLADIAMRWIDDAERIEWITRVYWYTIEFGLTREDDRLRIFGAGIVSSVGESTWCMKSSQPPHKHDFNLSEMLARPFRKDIFQDHYYVANGYAQLFESLPLLEANVESLTLSA